MKLKVESGKVESGKCASIQSRLSSGSLGDLFRKVALKLIVAFIFISFMVSCKIFGTRQVYKKQNKKHIVERGTIHYKVPREQIIYVPNIKVKDTDIVIRKPRTILRAKKRNGNFEKIGCEAPPADMKKDYVKETDESKKETDSKSEGLISKLTLKNALFLFLGLSALIAVNNLTKRK